MGNNRPALLLHFNFNAQGAGTADSFPGSHGESYTCYIPSEWIAKILGNNNTLAIPMTAQIGVPVYTTNMSALGIVGGLLSQGMNPAAALSFLIAGATTTLPAMNAVYGITRKPLFFLYVTFTLFGALLFGYIFQLIWFLF